MPNLKSWRKLAWLALIAPVAPLLAQTTDWPRIQLTPVYRDLNAPTDLQSPRDGSRRLFFVEQRGRIRVARDGKIAARPFLDIRSRVTCCGELGLLGLAFPPGFPDKPYFYVNYTTGGQPPRLRTVIARFRLTDDPDVAEPDSEEQILTYAQPFTNHKGGQLAFGPRDAFLYIATGDGGSGGDPMKNGQNRNALLAKLLRIDVESGTKPYAIPSSNPFAGMNDARGEVWAYGLRNPWRFSFDRTTGDLYIADVGQERYEEVDFQPADSTGGEDYGWRVMEGTHCLQDPCSSDGFVPPVLDYDHSNGCSVTGGYVYRGAAYPELSGIYFFADFCSGYLWGLRRNGDVWEWRLLLQSDLNISTFGQDEDGEIYAAHYDGVIYRLGTAASDSAP